MCSESERKRVCMSRMNNKLRNGKVYDDLNNARDGIQVVCLHYVLKCVDFSWKNKVGGKKTTTRITINVVAFHFDASELKNSSWGKAKVRFLQMLFQIKLTHCVTVMYTNSFVQVV